MCATTTMTHTHPCERRSRGQRHLFKKPTPCSYIADFKSDTISHIGRKKPPKKLSEALKRSPRRESSRDPSVVTCVCAVCDSHGVYKLVVRKRTFCGQAWTRGPGWRKLARAPLPTTRTRQRRPRWACFSFRPSRPTRGRAPRRLQRGGVSAMDWRGWGLDTTPRVL